LQQDFILITGGPDEKRRFIDIACSLLVPGYYQTLLRYNRALRQRNLQIRDDLENNRCHRHLWDEALAQTGLSITTIRSRIIRSLESMARARIAGMKSNTIELCLRYQSSLISKSNIFTIDEYKKHLITTERRENIFKSTVFGPHRDSLVFLHENRDMRSFASQGQIRMAVLAIKLALVDLLRQESNLYPVLLFDDFFIEIDPVNTQVVLESLGNYNQCIFTSTTVPKLDFFESRKQECFYSFTRNEV
jgi:DNA replication and repair protein RecF